MKRLYIFMCLIGCIIASMQLYAAEIATNHNIVYNTLHLNQNLQRDTLIKPFNGLKDVCGITIDATITQNPKSNHFVRILLQDMAGKTYLIAESYKEIHDTSTIILRNYSMETSTLNAISPTSIKCIIQNASIKIENVYIENVNSSKIRGISGYSQKKQDSVRYKQVEAIAKSINEYNIKHKKLWWAGVTPLSLKTYEERKRILRMTDDAATGGIEYYQGGIFELGEPTDKGMTPRSVSPYIEHFDWRNRHGKNWMTPAKDQGNSGYCVPFTVISATEAMINLYYNNLINLDLSEQNLGACIGTNPDTYENGMHYFEGLDYMKNFGAYDEVSYPFIDESTAQCRRDEIIPQQHVKIANYSYIGSSADDNIKQALIQNGPLVSGMNTVSPNNNYPIKHAMTLVGYKTIQAGDSICEIVEYNPTYHSYGFADQFIIEENDPRIGMTCWIFKDNYPKTRTYEEGYMYLLLHNPTFLNDTYSLSYPFTIMGYTDNDIICEDADGDGFYFWGLGNKPASCPSWVSSTPDGDDSDADYGPMDEYGFLESLQPDTRDTIFVTSNETASNYGYKYNHICINSGATLNITNSMIMHNGATITVRNGGSLIIDGGILDNASVNLLPGSRFVIKNNGLVKLASGNDLNIPLGVNAEIPHGCITPE